MKFSTTLLAALLPLLSLGAPTPEAGAKVEERQTLTCPGSSGGGCGVYTVSGLGTRKKAVIAAGGTSLDLAIAMMETEGMNTNYAYGDNKSGDAANFGIFKQNWYMIRSTSSTFSGQTASQYNNGAVLNSNLALDVTTRQNAQNYYGWDKWAGGHRNGQTGLDSPYTNDINLYKTAVLWTQSQINSNSAYLTDDTRFWVDVVAI